MNDRVKLSVFYPYPPEKVWQALTDCRILSVWMMNNDFEPRVGHKFKFESESLPGFKTLIHCEVVELEKPNRLVYTWQDKPTGASLVIWTLTPVEGGTQLQLKHQQAGYATAVVSSENNDFKPIDTRSGLFLDRQLVANGDRQIPETNLFPSTMRDELNSLLNHRDTEEEWNYRLDRKLPQALQRCQ